MGQSNQKLSNKQISELQQSTRFTRDELQEWHQVFMREHPSGRMDRETFIRENQFVHGGGMKMMLVHAILITHTNLFVIR
jgi:hypothetical protein